MRFDHLVYRDFATIGKPVRMATFSLGLLYLAWGFLDPYLSLIGYEVFGSNVAYVGYVSATLMLVSMLICLPAADLDSRISSRRGLILGKILYVITGVCWIMAIWKLSPLWLILAYIVNGLGSGVLHTSFDSYIREHASRKNESISFGFKAFLSNFMWVIGVVVSALWLVEDYGYLFLSWIVTGFLVLSLVFDLAMPSHKMGDFLRKFYDFIFRNRLFSRSGRHFFGYTHSVKFGFVVSFFWSFFDFLTFVFVPLLALQMELPLYQIGLLGITFRLPYLFSFFFSQVAQRHDAYRLLSVCFFGLAICVGLLGFAESHVAIFVLNLGIAFSLAFVYPTVCGYLSKAVPENRLAEISGMQNMFIKAGATVGALLFGYFSGENGIKVAFVVFSFLTLAVAFGCLSMGTYFKRTARRFVMAVFA